MITFRDGHAHHVDAHVIAAAGGDTLFAFVDDDNDLRVAIAAQTPQTCARVTTIVLIGDASPPTLPQWADTTPNEAIIAARLAAHQLTVVQRTRAEHRAAQPPSTSMQPPLPSSALTFAAGHVELQTVVVEQGDLARAASPASLDTDLASLTDVVIVGRVDDERLLDEVPELKARIAAGTLRLQRRSVEAQRDLDDAARVRRFGYNESTATTTVGEHAAAIAAAPPHRAPHAAAATLVGPSARPVVTRALTHDTRPRGPMSAHVGVTLAERNASDTRVYGWTLPALTGRLMVVHDVVDVGGAVRGVLFETFGDLPFRIDGPLDLRFPWELSLRLSVTAPADGDVPMALDLRGSVVCLGTPGRTALDVGQLLRRARPDQLVDDTREARKARAFAQLGSNLPRPLVVRIDAARYVNACLPSYLPPV